VIALAVDRELVKIQLEFEKYAEFCQKINKIVNKIVDE
jgi:hypothetical protein